MKLKLFLVCWVFQQNEHAFSGSSRSLRACFCYYKAPSAWASWIRTVALVDGSMRMLCFSSISCFLLFSSSCMTAEGRDIATHTVVSRQRNVAKLVMMEKTLMEQSSAFAKPRGQTLQGRMPRDCWIIQMWLTGCELWCCSQLYMEPVLFVDTYFPTSNLDKNSVWDIAGLQWYDKFEHELIHNRK